jgi:hypothetical protein
MRFFGDLDILWFVRKSQPNWIGQVNRIDSKRKVSHLFINNPKGRRVTKRPKNRWWMCTRDDWEKSVTEAKASNGL